MKLIRELRYIFPKRQWVLFGALFFLQLIETILDFAGISLILPFVNVLIRADELNGAWWYRLIADLIHTDSTQSVLLFLTFLMMAVYVAKNLYILLLVNLRIRFISANRIRMGAKMLTCYMHKPYTFHLQRNTAEIIRNVNGDVASAFSVISTIFSLISDVLIILVLIVYLLAVDIWMTLGVLCALIVCSAVYFLIVRRKVRKIGQENRIYGAKLIKSVHQSMGGIKEVKVMGREQYFADAYAEAGAQYVAQQRRFNVISAIPGRLIETLCMCSVLGVIAVRISAGGELTAIVPGLSAFAVAAIRLLPRANSVNSSINSITYNLPALESLYEDLKESERQEQERQLEIAEKKQRNKAVPVGAESDILLKNISYTYPNKDKPVLCDVNLRIEHGTSVGIVGVTGAGKTTLVDIILGLLKPDTGTVCYGALDIHEDYAQWQKHIGYIPQNIYLIDDTIRRNVALGVQEEAISDEAVWRALEHAQLAGFVRELKDGLDTVIGERGVRISGGQRQRIGIARALYDDPEILFFDEATSSLDNKTEEAVMESVHAIGGGKTIILVAHRLTTLKDCDRIYKVVNGGVELTTLETSWKNS